ncbi:hypothetical protein BSFA1_76700 (plasmid) [Burkholderia sp. SFA1]|nr:hypothetical protein BSFA1_76700 [Burkholderia sp. SFA1]
MFQCSHPELSITLEDGRRAAARSINALTTTTYWLVGRRVVESEQGEQGQAAYGQALWQRVSRWI